jgi:putative transposase
MTARGGKMAKVKAWQVTDEFWSRVEPLIPERQRIADLTYTREERGRT